MSVEGDKLHPFHYDRHTPDYIDRFDEITHELQSRCPISWTETYGGHWVAAGYKEVFEIARNPTALSSDWDPRGERKGYVGTSIPQAPGLEAYGGDPSFMMMDPPNQKEYRRILDPYLSPAAVERWKPMVEDLARACLDERIETGKIDFVDDLANIVPAVMTLALMGFPLVDWVIYNEPAHAQVFTPPDSPDMPRLIEQLSEMNTSLANGITDVRNNPRPGMVQALVDGEVAGRPLTDMEILGTLQLLIGGGFDTTTALTAHSLEWLGEHPAERERLRDELDSLLDSATEEFLRFYTPAPGNGRTVDFGCDLSGMKLEEGDRLWLSWAMANRDPSVFPDPDHIHIDRKGNRHTSFGLGVHRCIGSNVARAVYKIMMTAVLRRVPDFVCEPTGAVHYDTVGVINGMKKLPATFSPQKRLGAGLDETIAHWQKVIDEERLAEPVVRAGTAETSD
jgi:cytochrome P450